MKLPALEPLTRPHRPPGTGGGKGELEVAPQSEKERALERRLLCAACGEVVTSETHALEVQNQHAHTFVNPGGFVYKIRCFSRADGCRGEGESSDHWTWFPGYCWQIAACRVCGAHLGWIFRGADHVFFGLIVERLAESEG